MLDEVREQIWQEASEHLYCTREQYMAMLDDWAIKVLEVDDQPAFAILERGPEIHLITLRSGHRFPLKLFAAELERIVDQHGYVQTRTPKDSDARQHRANLRFGFKKADEDELDIIYRFTRSTPCPPPL